MVVVAGGFRATTIILTHAVFRLIRSRPDLTSAQLARTRRLMDENVGEALVSGYEHLIDQLSLLDPSDRHVLAAAIHGDAGVIVTVNLRHFPRKCSLPTAPAFEGFSRGFENSLRPAKIPGDPSQDSLPLSTGNLPQIIAALR
jgi:hypothetical protein